jgi:hypothetical protein
MNEKRQTYAGVIIAPLFLTTAIGFISNSKDKLNYPDEKLNNESISGLSIISN